MNNTTLSNFSRWLNASDLSVIGSSCGMGKSTAAMSILYNSYIKNGEGVLIFSLETSAENITKKVLSIEAEIPFYAFESVERWKSFKFDEEYMKKLDEAARKIDQYNVHIEDKIFFIEDLCEVVRSKVRDFKINIIYIDFLQILKFRDSLFQNKYEELSEIVLVLKRLSREMRVPILCASQLSRKVLERPSNRPTLNDFRDSGAIEEVADFVMLFYRRDYFDAYDKPGEAQIIVTKNRHGHCGCLKFYFCVASGSHTENPFINLR